MKKFMAIALSALMAMSVFTACGGDEGEKQPEAPAYDVAKVLETIETAAPVSNSTAVNEEYMDFIGIDAEMYDAYAGSYCPMTPGVDIILVVQAKEDKVADVETALTNRRDEIYNANENYPGPLTDKAQAGRIVVKGNYVVLAIAGNDEVVEAEGAEKAYEVVDAAIDEAFK